MTSIVQAIIRKRDSNQEYWEQGCISSVLLVENGATVFSTFWEEEIAKVLPKTILRIIYRKNTVKWMPTAIWRISARLQTSLYILNLPRNRQMKRGARLTLIEVRMFQRRKHFEWITKLLDLLSYDMKKHLQNLASVINKGT